MTILDRIIEDKREEVASARARRPFADLDAAARGLAAPRRLADALRRPPGAPVRVLAEIKRASPSVGPIRPYADPAEIAEAYAAGGAAAISVLTDERSFAGHLSFLARVRERVGLPLLRKDFIVDAYQVAEARAAGADAVLLIVAALSPAELGELMACAADYALDALVEVHDAGEADVALAAGATLLGVNHRDLRTFSLDMTLTALVAPRLGSDTVLVAESGIRGAADVAALGAAGAHAVLVGEHLMRSPSPELALRELIGGPDR